MTNFHLRLQHVINSNQTRSAAATYHGIAPAIFLARLRQSH
jgi:hypothetical protein